MVDRFDRRDTRDTGARAGGRYEETRRDRDVGGRDTRAAVREDTKFDR